MNKQLIKNIFKLIVAKVTLARLASRFENLKKEAPTLPTGKNVTLHQLFNWIYEKYSTVYKEEGLKGVNNLRKELLNELQALNWSMFTKVKHKDGDDTLGTISEYKLGKAFKHLIIYKDIITKVKYTVATLLLLRIILSTLTNATFIPIFVLTLAYIFRRLFIWSAVALSHGTMIITWAGYEDKLITAEEYLNDIKRKVYSWLLNIINLYFNPDYIPKIEEPVYKAPIYQDIFQKTIDTIPTESLTWIHTISILGIPILLFTSYWQWPVIKGAAVWVTAKTTAGAGTIAGGIATGVAAPFKAGFYYTMKGVFWVSAKTLALLALTKKAGGGISPDDNDSFNPLDEEEAEVKEQWRSGQEVTNRNNERDRYFRENQDAREFRERRRPGPLPPNILVDSPQPIIQPTPPVSASNPNRRSWVSWPESPSFLRSISNPWTIRSAPVEESAVPHPVSPPPASYIEFVDERTNSSGSSNSSGGSPNSDSSTITNSTPKVRPSVLQPILEESTGEGDNAPGALSDTAVVPGVVKTRSRRFLDAIRVEPSEAVASASQTVRSIILDPNKKDVPIMANYWASQKIPIESKRELVSNFLRYRLKMKPIANMTDSELVNNAKFFSYDDLEIVPDDKVEMVTNEIMRFREELT